MLVVDAGGGTIDISSYAVTSNTPLQVEELFQPKCQSISTSFACPITKTIPSGLLQGGEFVTTRATEAVSGRSKFHSPDTLPVQPQAEKLKTSKFHTPEDIAAFTQKFDEGLKRVFSGDTGTQYIKFGSPRDNDPDHGIRAGRLALTG